MMCKSDKNIMGIETVQHPYIAPDAAFLDADRCFTVLCVSLALDPIEENTDDIQWEN